MMRYEGYSAAETAKILGINRSSVYLQYKRYETEGLEGFTKSKYNGHHRALTEAQEKEILDQFEKAAEAGQVVTVQEIKRAFDEVRGKDTGRGYIPDNAKTATITNNRYEVVLNRSYQELAEHYGTAIVPARVRRPDDKAAAEGSVKYVSTWITAALRDRKFFTLDEARRAVIEKLEELNRRPFKKRAGCRFSAFEEEEREFMRPLPTTAYEPSVWSHPKVSYDYLVSDAQSKLHIRQCLLLFAFCIA